MRKKLQRIKNRIKNKLPISRGTYAMTFSSFIKLREADKEAEMFLRNDVYQLGKEIHDMQSGVNGAKDKKKEDDDVAFG